MDRHLQAVFAEFGVRGEQRREIAALLERAGVLEKDAPLPQLALLDPANIQTDAKTYQFRFGGDGAGVTKNGRYHTDRWDAILHGDPLLVHERLDGTLFVADGHHRLDLAKRLNAKGAGPGKVAAQVLREADGYTTRDVKIIAAYKNIAHGQTDPLETAQVFREARAIDHPQWLPSLQMDKGNLRMSLNISYLPEPVAQGRWGGMIRQQQAAQMGWER